MRTVFEHETPLVMLFEILHPGSGKSGSSPNSIASSRYPLTCHASFQPQADLRMHALEAVWASRHHVRRERLALFGWAPELGSKFINCYDPGTDISLECYGSCSFHSPIVTKVGRGRTLAGVMLASEEFFTDMLAMAPCHLQGLCMITHPSTLKEELCHPFFSLLHSIIYLYILLAPGSTLLSFTPTSSIISWLLVDFSPRLYIPPTTDSSCSFMHTVSIVDVSYRVAHQV